ncbi:uncharacterized protein C8R40DRAFT_1096815 [Lentinula edodes]|uniref:uncharacterized protein n=1 Tax=Lentinula edodes TaxID=5353 RepID=UPI001E8EC66F|nr:uncharacterized protein C8R40DRAFT_1096815 [Lentinula edodes]KAH7876968.1 hypothetical protein C8R40DRAFT_1096815 [Lentinula edodes]
MVSRKSTKTAKLTYAERIVCAMHALQKSQRRGGFHSASIKAQVRKDAEERNDKLGPQWPTWVMKALNRLNESGLLSRSVDNPAHFEMSPASKKILKESERTLPVVGPLGEEFLAKHLFRATAGKKRPAESGIDSTPTKKSRATRTFKESAPRSPWLKKRKAELVEEIERLQRERLQRERLQSLQVPSRSPSPLTDLDDNEDVRIFDTDEHNVPSQSHSSTPELPTRPSTPVEPDQMSFPSTPVRLHSSLTRSRPLLQVTRTHSGSYIANGRPTPDPPEPADRDIHHGLSLIMGNALSDNECHSPVINRPNGLVTPGPTPARTVSSHGSIHSQTMANELARISEENKQLRAVEATQASDIGNLNSQIQSLRQMNIDNKERVTTLLAETSTLQAALAQSTQRCSSLDAQLSAGTAEIASLQVSLDTKNQQITDFVQKLQDTNTTLEARTQDLNSAQLVAAKLENDLAAMTSQLDNREVELTSQLVAAKRSMEDTSSTLQQKTTELSNLHEDLRKAQKSVSAYQEELEAHTAAHAAEIGECSATIDSLRASLSSADTTAVDLRSKIGLLTETCTQLQSKLEQAASDRTRLGEELAVERLHSATIRGELDQALSRIHEAEQEMGEMESLRSEDAATIMKLRNTIERIHVAQMEQWAGITQEVTQASPAPRRPRFSI